MDIEKKDRFTIMKLKNELPEGWEEVKLGDIFDICAGGDVDKLDFSKGKTQKYKFPIYSNSLENNGLYGYADSYQYPGNCITVTGRGTLGHAIPRFKKFNAIIRLLVLIPKIDVNIIFVCEYINAKINFNLEKTSIPQLTIPKLSPYKIPLPPREEQKRIAEVLGTMDSAIGKVEEAIERTKRLKNGLMQKLLTQGIGHKEFKDSEIGRIPKEWEVVRLKNIGKIHTGKTPSTAKNKFWNGKIPFITPGDLQGKYVTKTERFVTSEGVEQVGKILPKNSILVVCIGSTIGKTGMTFTESITNQQINTVIPQKDNAHYVYYTLSFRSKLLNSYSGVAAVPIIKKSLFENYKIPLPPLQEQERIAEILSEVDRKAELEKRQKEKLDRIKKGLMEDLLTGRKKVRI